MNLRKLIFCKPNRRNGFTLIELLLALMISVIILESVVTFAFAIGHANDAAGDTSEKQARVRYVTLRLSELLKHGKLICSVPGNDLLVWRADDNGDDQVNINELIWIQVGPYRNFIRLCEFKSSTNTKRNLVDLRTITQMMQLKNSHNGIETVLIPQCSNVRFYFDAPPPWTRFISLSFDLLENEVMHHYQVNATLRNRPDNLLDESGNLE